MIFEILQNNLKIKYLFYCEFKQTEEKSGFKTTKMKLVMGDTIF